MPTANIDKSTAPGTKGAYYAVADGTERMIDNRYCRAFIPDNSGTLSVIFAEGTSAVAVTVIGGAEYHFSCKQFRSTGTTGVTGVTIIA